MNRRPAESALPRHLLFAVLCVSLSAPARHASAQARYVGHQSLDTSAIVSGDTTDERVVTIMGRVTSVHVSKAGMIFLNIGGASPLVAIITPSAASRFPNPTQWVGTRVHLQGRLQQYETGPAIVLVNPWQLAPATPGPSPM